MTLTKIDDAAAVGGISKLRTFIPFPVGHYRSGGETMNWGVSNTSYAIPYNYVQTGNAATTDEWIKQEYDPTKYSNILQILFEATLVANTGGATVYAELWNATDSVAITGSEVSLTSTTAARKRSADILANMPATSKYLSLRLKATSGWCFVGGSQLIIDQSSV